jgi:hypothetical protein
MVPQINALKTMTLRGIVSQLFCFAKGREPASPISLVPAVRFPIWNPVNTKKPETCSGLLVFMTQVSANWNQLIIELNAWYLFGRDLEEANAIPELIVL